MALPLSRLALAALFGTGVWTIQVFARSNNLFPMMESFKDRLVLPHTETKFDPTFTGVHAIDDVFAFVLMFFWPIIDGKHPALSLSSFAFGAQAAAAWALTMLEGMREGNAWKAISFTAVYGMLSQLLGMGMIAPAYFFLHTFTSPLLSAPTSKLISPSLCSSLAAIPAAITISYAVPMVLMNLPAPTYLTLSQKIIAHNAWQVFPITCSLTHFILSWIWPFNPAPTSKNLRSYLRFVYKFALTIAVPAHIATGTVTMSAYLLPELLNPTLASLLHPLQVWLPPKGAFEGAKAATVGEGALWFIQWDYFLMGSSYLVWSIAARQQARKFILDKEGFGIAGLLKVGTRVAVLGPVGAAVVYIWERDEAVFEAAETVERKKLK